MNVITIESQTVEAFEARLSQEMASGFCPTLGIVFASANHDLEAIRLTLKDRKIAVFGAGSAAEIGNNEVYENSIVALMFEIDEAFFSTYYEEVQDGETYEVSRNATRFAMSKYEHPAMLVLGAGLDTDGNGIVQGIRETYDPPFPVFGGMASNFDLTTTTIITDSCVSNHGLSFLVFNNEKVSLKGIAANGWESLGVEKVITKSEGNVVYTIDNEPALDLFLKYYQVDVDKPIGLSIGSYPLLIRYKDEEPLLRSPLSVNLEDRSIILTSKIHQGSRVKFTVQPTFEIIDNIVEDFEAFNAKEQEDPDAMIMFSCFGRKLAFGPLLEDEVHGVQGIWDKPSIGMLSFGEIGATKDHPLNFHDLNCSLVLLKEL